MGARHALRHITRALKWLPLLGYTHQSLLSWISLAPLQPSTAVQIMPWPSFLPRNSEPWLPIDSGSPSTPSNHNSASLRENASEDDDEANAQTIKLVTRFFMDPSHCVS